MAASPERAPDMRILLIRTSALGDVVHALPVLEALRRQRPDARIAWLVEAGIAPLLDGHPDLDDLIVVRLREWRRRPFAVDTIRQVRRFFGDLRRFAPEVVVDLMGNHKAAVLGALTLCDRRIGAARTDRREPSSAIWINEPVTQRGGHVIERTLSLLEPLGVQPGEPRLGGDRLPLGTAAPEDAPPRYFLVHPGAGWENKRYPPELWGEAARRLREASGLPGLVVAGPGESDLAAAAACASDGALTHVATDGLERLTSLLRHARLVLAGDTGPLHLARALGTEVLCVMGPTDPRRNGPFGHADDAVWQPLPCSFCHRRFDAPRPCLTLIPPATVAGRAGRMLGL